MNYPFVWESFPSSLSSGRLVPPAEGRGVGAKERIQEYQNKSLVFSPLSSPIREWAWHWVNSYSLTHTHNKKIKQLLLLRYLSTVGIWEKNNRTQNSFRLNWQKLSTWMTKVNCNGEGTGREREVVDGVFQICTTTVCVFFFFANFKNFILHFNKTVLSSFLSKMWIRKSVRG